MINYEMERKLDDKVNKWELHTLQTENSNLRNRVSELENKLDSIERKIYSRHETFMKLLDILSRTAELELISNDIVELSHNIY